MNCTTWQKLKYIKMIIHVKKVLGANIKKYIFNVNKFIV